MANNKIYLKRRVQSKPWVDACNKLGLDPKGIFIKGSPNRTVGEFCKIISTTGIDVLGVDNEHNVPILRYWDSEMFDELDEIAVMVFEAIENKKRLF